MERLPVSPIVSRTIELAAEKIGLKGVADRIAVPIGILEAWRDGKAAVPRADFLRLVDVLLELDVGWDDWDGKAAIDPGAAMQPDNAGSPRRQLTILIADDEPDAVMTLAAVLKDEGHVVHTCMSGEACIDAITHHRPDVCIIDIVMPLKTGFSVVRDVYKLKLPKRPVLIALSGVFTRPKDDVVAKSVGFDYLIRKASDPTQLLRLIHDLARAGLPGVESG